MSSISIGYNTTTVSFDQFSGDDLPRSYLSQATLDFSALGVAYSTGSTKRQRKIWAVAAVGTIQQWNNLVIIFEQWDLDRSRGSNVAAVTIQDTLLGSNINTFGFFTTAPTLGKLSPGNNTLFVISFAITEI